MLLVIFFFKQKTAYDMRISDWSSDVCSSDLFAIRPVCCPDRQPRRGARRRRRCQGAPVMGPYPPRVATIEPVACIMRTGTQAPACGNCRHPHPAPPCRRRVLLTACGCARSRSEEHTSELQSLILRSYVVIFLKK